ncbi:HNH endonuclease signature motif containing protein [Micromonospora sp. NPDC052213]|uniref:HNH endonuclease n=1 Tax=Micromonospora sp. NPDC052213 TaxID=3155812 RepID=UPI00341D6126
MSETNEQQHAQRECRHCGGSMEGKPARAIYCTRRCKEKAAARRNVTERNARHRDSRKAWKKAHRKTDAGKDARWAEMAKRRARAHGAPVVELVKRRDVFERDGWICLLCGEPTLRETGTDPRSASVDHTVPLADGGSHTYDNAVTAHLACNVWEKRTKSLDEYWLARWDSVGGELIPIGRAITWTLLDPAGDLVDVEEVAA